MQLGTREYEVNFLWTACSYIDLKQLYNGSVKEAYQGGFIIFQGCLSLSIDLIQATKLNQKPNFRQLKLDEVNPTIT